ncbi:helix-turn-helix transcriptional regulator [Streptomyces spiramenti]|uniref:Helix-turn-helix transcriptional regulator n=1 Tax=Streptomyces spiramenti TaxID=2720606 RepID=A0ABX1AQD3_9ACTN|nr:helix-turn-helix transcriptional regulator [Streptomyces spiramenti]NJP68371.1 helix-turn-helix transcriptional regulator [Streptomyces spiramenti]
MYRERTTPLVPGAVLWSRAPEPATAEQRVLPDGCTDLIWCDGLLVAGPDSRAHLATTPPGVAFDAIRLPPGAGAAVFGLPAAELRDQRLPLASLWDGATVRSLTDRLADAPDRGAVLAAVARARLDAAAGSAPGAGEDADSLRRLVLAHARRGTPVAETARAAGISERQLHRRCLALFGYGAKHLARVLRLQRALDLVAAGVPTAEAAARSGYADQPHLAREVRQLAGVPLSRLR